MQAHPLSPFERWRQYIHIILTARLAYASFVFLGPSVGHQDARDASFRLDLPSIIEVAVTFVLLEIPCTTFPAYFPLPLSSLLCSYNASVGPVQIFFCIFLFSSTIFLSLSIATTRVK